MAQPKKKWSASNTIPFIQAVDAFRRKYFAARGSEFDVNDIRNFAAIAANTVWPKKKSMSAIECKAQYFALMRVMDQPPVHGSTTLRNLCKRLRLFEPLVSTSSSYEGTSTMLTRVRKLKKSEAAMESLVLPATDMETDSESDMSGMEYDKSEEVENVPNGEAPAALARLEANQGQLMAPNPPNSPLTRVVLRNPISLTDPLARTTVPAYEPKKRLLATDDTHIMQETTHQFDIAALAKDQASSYIPLEHARIAAEQERFRATERRLDLERELEREKMKIMQDLEMRKIAIDMKRAEAEATEKARQTTIMEKMFLMMMEQNKKPHS